MDVHHQGLLGEVLALPEVGKEADALLAGFFLILLGQVPVLVLHELRDRVESQSQELLVQLVFLVWLGQEMGGRGELQKYTYDGLPVLKILML